jgi:hypothetical protein
MEEQEPEASNSIRTKIVKFVGKEIDYIINGLNNIKINAHFAEYDMKSIFISILIIILTIAFITLLFYAGIILIKSEYLKTGISLLAISLLIITMIVYAIFFVVDDFKKSN